MVILSKDTVGMVKERLSEIKNSVKLIFFKSEGGCEHCKEIEELIDKLIQINPKLSKEVYVLEKDVKKAKELNIDKAPALLMHGKEKGAVRFFGVPSGHQFEIFLLDLVDISKGWPGLAKDGPGFPHELAEKVKAVDFPVHIQVFATPNCFYCSGAVKVAHDFAMLNPNITGDGIDAMEFKELAQKYGVMSVPKTVINEKIQFVGPYPPNVVLKKIMKLKK